MAIVEGVQGGAAVKYSRITYIHIPLLHSSYSMCAACVGAAWVVQHVGVAWVWPGCVVGIAEKWRHARALAWLVHFTWLDTPHCIHELELFPIDRTVAILVHLQGHRVRDEERRECGYGIGPRGYVCVCRARGRFQDGDEV